MRRSPLDHDLRNACFAALDVSTAGLREFASQLHLGGLGAGLVDSIGGRRGCCPPNRRWKQPRFVARAFRSDESERALILVLTRFLTRTGIHFARKRLESFAEVSCRASIRRDKSDMTEQHLPIRPRRYRCRARVIRLSPSAPRCLSFPVLTSVSAHGVLKPEMLQRTGSFKFRGAFNKVASIPQDKRAGGVVGSPRQSRPGRAPGKDPRHAGTIVMPADAPLSSLPSAPKS